jgi:DNA-directed RNA polymerase alpha subunit
MQNNVSIDVLDLSVRARNCLINAGLDTIDKLSSCPKDDLMRVRNLGQRSYYEVINKLTEYQKQLVVVDDLISNAINKSKNYNKQNDCLSFEFVQNK